MALSNGVPTGRTNKGPELHNASPAPGTAALFAFFEQNSTLLRLARHQRLPLHPAGACLVRRGLLALQTATPRRQIVGFWHPGDVLETANLPALPGLAVSATAPTEVWRLRPQTLESILTERADLLRLLLRLSAIAMKQLLVSNAMIGKLSGEERVASFLLTMAMRHGRFGSNRAEVDLPLSRADMADHLGLNADTLSRIMSALRTAGIIESLGRHRLVVRDWRRLRGRSPLADALASN
ncbi:MAG TPA: Crp/Fnr family transcriptional regulator [Hyphomicrobiaceae bacterium]|nr:Crp/Fnr family transcriptional regulator [Hyphomicrobiaceae bacterium]